jgi:Fe-S-cluster containining protein
MPSKPWYDRGLQFECVGCGRCCTGDPGYVWVTGEEIAALAHALDMEPNELEKACVRCVGKRKSLVEMPNGDCVFFDSATRRCRVYQSRPSQCRTWPFWQSNVDSPRAWAQARRICPGSGRGPVFAREAIDRLVAAVRP